ncbi:hypothetical protein [Streptomyces sp. Ru72]|uniref:hypothetical protein n=1 Tax=Streptomyces sp. Ru72 TaxID=2080747 RepID=UPI000CDD9FEC|nr:hypothetical protein C3488_13240 [Streptomyces sp. Ru72]
MFDALLEDLIAETAKRDEADLSLVGIDSTTARAHHDAVGMFTPAYGRSSTKYTPNSGVAPPDRCVS